MMKKSHDTNHKEWTAQDELDKFRLLLCVNKPRAQMFEKVRLKLYTVGCFWPYLRPMNLRENCPWEEFTLGKKKFFEVASLVGYW